MNPYLEPYRQVKSMLGGQIVFYSSALNPHQWQSQGGSFSGKRDSFAFPEKGFSALCFSTKQVGRTQLQSDRRPEDGFPVNFVLVSKILFGTQKRGIEGQWHADGSPVGEIKAHHLACQPDGLDVRRFAADAGSGFGVGH